MKNALNLIGWLGTGLVVAAVGIRMLRPEMDQYAVYGAWAGLACVVLYTLGQYREIIDYFKQRNARYGAMASLSALIFLGVLVAVNYLSTRQNKRWDVTKNQAFTLSDQTVKLLTSLDAPVTFKVFDREDKFPTFRASLEEYRYHNPSKVLVEYLDVDKRPGDAKQYQIQSYGTVVLEYKGRVERVLSSPDAAPEEAELTNGLVKVISGEKKKLYFVQGHGERDIEDSERTGYNGAAAALRRDNYDVAKVVLAQEMDVPADASVVVIAGPKTDLVQTEADMLERYLEKGGHVLVLLDPPADGAPPAPVLDALLRTWDFEMGKDVVVDASGMGQLLGTDASVPVVATYPNHPITDKFSVLTAFPLARSVTPILPASNGRAAIGFLQTSPRSWAETDQVQVKAGTVELNEDKGDKKGPVTIGAVTATNAINVPGAAAGKDAKAPVDAHDTRPPESRFAVIGDSDFAANYALGIQGNSDLFMNVVNYLAQQENLIAIRPKPPADSRLTITAQQMRAISILSLLVVPALVFGSGVYTWWRRR